MLLPIERDCNLLKFYHFFLTEQDPNQLIRGSALRVLSSIRVPVIAPIMMLSIKEASAIYYGDYYSCSRCCIRETSELHLITWLKENKLSELSGLKYL